MSATGIERPRPVREWVEIGWAADVPLLEGRSVSVDGRRIAVFRLREGWAATDQRCPHLGGPLGDGILADGCVTCPLHGRRFSLIDGRLQNGDGEGVRTYRVRERDGRLELLRPVDEASLREAA